jgi:addiction module RelB/DinJ family antitoxin
MYREEAHMSTITFDIDEEVRDGAETVLSSLNLTLDEAVSMFLNAVVRENGLPQGLKREQLILERVREADDEDNLSPVFSSMEEARPWLEA